MLEDLIFDLQRMPGPDRQADKTIAYAIGMMEEERQGVDCWVLGERVFRRIPAFTATVDAAFFVAEVADPNHCGACTFGENGAAVVFEGGEKVVAATPAIAICIGALKLIQAKQVA